MGLCGWLLAACAGGMDGVFHYEDGEFEKARIAFERAATARPADPAVHFWLGKTYAELGDLVAASQAWDRSQAAGLRWAEDIEKLRLDHWMTQQTTGELLMERDPPQPSAALQAFHNALAMRPGNTESRHGLAYTYSVVDSVDAARRIYDGLIEENPGDVAAYRALSLMFLAAGQFADARPHAEQVVAYEPLEPDGLRRLSWIYQQLGRFEDAADTAERLSVVAPEDVDNLLRLGFLYEQIDEVDRAGSAYSRALDEEPSNIQALRAKASYLSRYNDDEKALPLWEILSTQLPHEAEVWRELARIYDSRGDEALAQTAQQRLRDLPQSVE